MDAKEILEAVNKEIDLINNTDIDRHPIYSPKSICHMSANSIILRLRTICIVSYYKELIDIVYKILVEAFINKFRKSCLGVSPFESENDLSYKYKQELVEFLRDK